MSLKPNRQYRTIDNIQIQGDTDTQQGKMVVRGVAVSFDTQTVLFEMAGVEYKEIIDRRAFDDADMSDVIMNYNHGGKVVARLRNQTLRLHITETGVEIEADLSGTEEGRRLYEEIKGGYIDRMSFSFTVREEKYDRESHTNTIKRIKKLYDVSAVDIPAYEETSLSARKRFSVEHEEEMQALEQVERRKKRLEILTQL